MPDSQVGFVSCARRAHDFLILQTVKDSTQASATAFHSSCIGLCTAPSVVLAQVITVVDTASVRERAGSAGVDPVANDNLDSGRS